MTGQRQFRLLIAAVLLLWIGFTACAAQPTARPNIIFILADDLGAGDLGCYGGSLAPTPNLDRMAREGTRFTQYYTAAPICSPSRAGLITGRFPARSQITSFLQTRRGNRGCEQADFLDPKAPSLPRSLRSGGYATAHFGKWHLGGGRDVTNAPPFSAYGYDEHAGTYESPQPHPDITGTNWIWSAHDKVKRWDRSAFFVDKTLEFLASRREQPCFVNLWLDDPHTPWVPSADAQPGQSKQNLRRVLTEMDRQIGRLLDGLKARGLETNTLVIFTSDNGALPTFAGSRSASLRGSKLSLYEGGLRVPFIALWTGRVPANRVEDRTVLSAVDMLPTLCTLASVKLPSEIAFDGEDLSGAFSGKTVDRKKPLFWEYGRNEAFFKFPEAPGQRSPSLAVRDGKWKLLVNADGGGAELYDLSADRNEETNLVSRQTEVAKRLSDLVLDWRKSWPADVAARE